MLILIVFFILAVISSFSFSLRHVFYTNANNADGTSDICIQNRSGFLCGRCGGPGDICVAID